MDRRSNAGGTCTAGCQMPVTSGTDPIDLVIEADSAEKTNASGRARPLADSRAV
jgi:hypothetical protein